eukprot:12322977-Alexandrium_andersonii.AAC.1
MDAPWRSPGAGPHRPNRSASGGRGLGHPHPESGEAADRPSGRRGAAHPSAESGEEAEGPSGGR